MKTALLFRVLVLIAVLSGKPSLTAMAQQPLHDRFAPPAGFVRMAQPEGAFGAYLRQLPLKAEGASVTYYDGRTKNARGVYAAVVDLPIGTRDLHQCADAVMRLRADYLYAADRKEEISFNLTNGFAVPYSRWAAGERVAVDGNRTWWKSTASPADNATVYWKYLEFVWSYAGTASLAKELEPVALNELAIGDVFIRGGFPGHAVLVVDKAVHPTTGAVRFMLAQSYMPAQEIQILLDPTDGDVWYAMPEGNRLITPEWYFNTDELRRWP